MAKYVITAIGEEVARVYKGTDTQPGIPGAHTHIPYVDNNLVPLGLFKWDNVNMVYNETIFGGHVMQMLMYFDEYSFGGAVDSFALKANYKDQYGESVLASVVNWLVKHMWVAKFPD